MLSAIAITNIVKHIEIKYADRIFCATRGKHLNYSKMTYRFQHQSQAQGREFDVGIASITLTKHENNFYASYKNKINFIDFA